MENADKRALLTELSKIYKIDGLDISAVSVEICPEDNMFVAGYEDHYFNVGFSGLRNILISLACAQKDQSEIKTILDFPSGWGRELRFIKAYFPEAEITACEIEEGALRFCRDQFDVDTLVSHHDFHRIPVAKRFDLIWCGSLFTHLNAYRFKELIEFFYNSLNEDGILSFTTHGRYSKYLLDSGKFRYDLDNAEIIALVRQYENEGYGYVDYKGRNDYGVSLIKPSWTVDLLERDENWKLILYNEKGYDNHQDVITCLKQPVSEIPKWRAQWIERRKGTKQASSQDS